MQTAPALTLIFVIAVALNFAWEMAQAPLYGPMGTLWAASRRCFIASLGDGVLTLGVVLLGHVVFGTPAWFARRSRTRTAFAVITGLGLAVAVELWGLQMRRWSYLPWMPLLPGTRIGLVPLAQMAILVPLALQLTGRVIGRTPRRTEVR